MAKENRTSNTSALGTVSKVPNWRFLLFSIVLSVAATVLVLVLLKPAGLKVGFIRSHDIVYKYSGTLEAKRLHEAKKAQRQTTVDSLEAELQKMEMKAQGGRHSDAADTMGGSMLGKQRASLRQYEMKLADEDRNEEQKEIEGVLTQINDVAKKYAEANGIDLLLGTPQSGNIVYGAPALDVTDAVLRAANSQFSSGKSK